MSSAIRLFAPRRDRLLETLFVAPGLLLSVVVFVGTMLWTISLSFTDSRSLPGGRWIGFAQYVRLWTNDRWLTSIGNLGLYTLASVVLSLSIGVALAVVMDGRRRGTENALRTLFMYPYATSMVVTGLAWQWLLTPSIGIQAALRDLGWSTGFVWLSEPRWAIYAVALASAWQSAGLVMVIVLAAIQGLDPDIQRAARLDGIPRWRIQWSIVLPQVRGAIGGAMLLLLMGAVRTYDLVVAMTHGGPGDATDLPARFTMSYLFQRQNVGLASAAATSLLLGVALLVACGAALRRAGSRAR